MKSQIGIEMAYQIFFKDYPDVLDLKQICEILRVSKKTGYDLIQSNKIKSLKVGRSYRIPKMFLLNYLGIEVSKNEK